MTAWRYRTLANQRQRSQASKQSRVKDYIDSIPTDLSSEGTCSTDSPKSPQSSRSVTSKETILLRDVSKPYTITSCDSVDMDSQA